MTTPPRDPNRDLSGIQPMLPGEPVDEDMAEQAVPGHGIPSQDPAAGAQVGMTEAESEREAKSAYVGGGAMAGMARNLATTPADTPEAATRSANLRRSILPDMKSTYALFRFLTGFSDTLFLLQDGLVRGTDPETVRS